MTYFDHGTDRVTNDEDIAIAMTSEMAITPEVDIAIAQMVLDGTLEPMWMPEAA